MTSAPPPARRLGPYTIEGVIGRGGMGAVYRGRHEHTGAVHAVKVILAGRLQSERAIARFRREAELLARIALHPNVVRVHTFGVDDGSPWCAMDLVEGEPLSARLARGPMRPVEAARLLVSVARAIAHVHRHHVIHRDIKPDNVIVDAADVPRLVDFGLAYDVFADHLTRTGECVGTPAFMAPEQLRGAPATGEADPIGPATDVYGLGALLYACLTGRSPFGGLDVLAQVAAVMRADPTPASSVEPSVPAALDAVCLRCLRKDPAARYPSADALADDLERWLRGESVEAEVSGGGLQRVTRRLRGVHAVVLGVGLVGLAGLMAALGAGPGASPADLVADGRRQLERDGRLDPGLRERLEALIAADADEPAMRRQLRVLVRIDRLVEAPDRIAAIELAELLRPQGLLDRRLLGVAAQALDRAGRPFALDRILHRVDPAEPAPTELARRLARAMAAAEIGTGERDAPWPPLDGPAFDALLRAPELASAQKGRLHHRRAERRLAAASPDRDGALDDIIAAMEVGAPPPPGLIDAGLHRHAVGRFLRHLVDEDDPEAARAVADVVVRAGHGDAGLEPELIARLQYPLGPAVEVAGFGRASREQARLAIEVGALLEAHGAWTRYPDEHGPFLELIGLPEIRALGERERARPAAQRNPARLIMLASVLIKTDEIERAAGWVDAAVETGVEAIWLHRIAGTVYGELGRHEAKWRHIEAALALDRMRPDARRDAYLPAEAASVLVRIDDEDALSRAAAGALEAARVQAAGAERETRMAEAGAVLAWHDKMIRWTVRVLVYVIDALMKRDAPACCPDGAGAATAQRLLDAALEDAMPEEGFALENVVATSDTPTRSSLLQRRARHHERHERLEQAERDLDRAILSIAAVDPAERMMTLAELHEHRAALRERVGKTDLAKKDELRAAEYRARADRGR